MSERFLGRSSRVALGLGLWLVLSANVLAQVPPASSLRGSDDSAARVEARLRDLEEALAMEEGLSERTRAALLAAIESLRLEVERLRSDAADRASDAESRAPSAGRVEEAVERYLASRAEQPVASSGPSRIDRLLSKLTVYGDARMRGEQDFRDGESNRFRGRLRFRLGANYAVGEEFVVGGRVVTGDREDARSTHVTLGNGLDDLEIALDRAFLEYHPAWERDLRITAGKFNHPMLHNPIFGELVWDDDVQPEGIAIDYQWGDLGGILESVDLHLAEYILLEQSTADDAMATVAQLSADFRLAKAASGSLAFTYYYYSDASPDGSQILVEENDGNATIDRNGDGIPDDFVSDFEILNPVAVLEVGQGEWPLTFVTEYMKNFGAEGDLDQGFVAGAAIGRKRERGDLRAYYQWQLVEQDAVFSPFAQDDFLRTTNHRSHVMGLQYVVDAGTVLHLWGLMSTPDRDLDENDGSDSWRLRLDLDLKF